MEAEPYQDTIPPRHQVESDESDEDEYPSTSAKRTVLKSHVNVVVHLKGPQGKRQPLLVALDEAGRQWARGVKLDEVKGRIVVDNVEIASVFTPSFAEVAVVCINTRLPIYMIHDVASTVISAMQPTNVIVIDAYPVPSYISPSLPALQPPIRYLRTTAASKNIPPDGVEPFYPPNLIQSPAASFLSILELSKHATPATLLLLPSAHIPPPVPSELERCCGPELREEWEPLILQKLHRIVGSILGIDMLWSFQHPHSCDRSTRFKTSRRGDIGDGGMYV